jgi:hypothetical protein
VATSPALAESQGGYFMDERLATPSATSLDDALAQSLVPAVTDIHGTRLARPAGVTFGMRRPRHATRDSPLCARTYASMAARSASCAHKLPPINFHAVSRCRTRSAFP